MPPRRGTTTRPRGFFRSLATLARNLFSAMPIEQVRPPVSFSTRAWISLAMARDEAAGDAHEGGALLFQPARGGVEPEEAERALEEAVLGGAGVAGGGLVVRPVGGARGSALAFEEQMLSLARDR